MKAKAPPSPTRRAADLAASWQTPLERQREATRRRDAAIEIARQDFRTCAVSGDAEGARAILKSMINHAHRADAWRTLTGHEATALARACPEILDVVAPGLGQLELDMLEIDGTPDDELPEMLVVRLPSQRVTSGGPCTAKQAAVLQGAGLTVESRAVRPDLAARFGGGLGYPQNPVDLVQQGRPDRTYQFRGFAGGRGLPITRTREVRIPAGNCPDGAPGITRDQHGQCWYVRTVSEPGGEDPMGPPHMLAAEVVRTLQAVDPEFRALAKVTLASPDEIRRRLKIQISNDAMRLMP